MSLLAAVHNQLEDTGVLDTERMDTRRGKRGAPRVRMAGANLGAAVLADAASNHYLMPKAKELGTHLGNALVPVGRWLDNSLGINQQ